MPQAKRKSPATPRPATPKKLELELDLEAQSSADNLSAEYLTPINTSPEEEKESTPTPEENPSQQVAMGAHPRSAFSPVCFQTEDRLKIQQKARLTNVLAHKLYDLRCDAVKIVNMEEDSEEKRALMDSLLNDPFVFAFCTKQPLHFEHGVLPPRSVYEIRHFFERICKIGQKDFIEHIWNLSVDLRQDCMWHNALLHFARAVRHKAFAVFKGMIALDMESHPDKRFLHNAILKLQDDNDSLTEIFPLCTDAHSSLCNLTYMVLELMDHEMSELHYFEKYLDMIPLEIIHLAVDFALKYDKIPKVIDLLTNYLDFRHEQEQLPEEKPEECPEDDFDNDLTIAQKQAF